MPTLADIYSAADSFKRRLADAAMNPGASLQQMLGYANDRARGLNEQIGQAASQPEFVSPQDRQMAAQLAESYNPVGMTVWHGSPYKFTKFDPSKIGTGEGAQAYGHGLYVAENPEVASSYKKTLQGQGATKPDWAYLTIGGKSLEEQTAKMSPSVVGHVTKVLKETNGDVDAALKKFKTESKGYENNPIVNDVLNVLYKGKGTKVDLNAIPGGNLYKIDLPDEHIEKMLDWDKPLSEQPEIVKSMTPESMGLKLREPVGGGFMAYIAPNGKPIGLQMKGTTPEKFRESWINRLQEIGDLEGGAGRAVGYLGGTSSDLAPSVSEAMRKAGIPGIKYFDEGSRGAKQGTRNFVVFPGNEHLLNITDINGNPLK